MHAFGSYSQVIVTLLIGARAVMGLGAAAAFPLALGMHTAVVVCAIVSLVAAVALARFVPGRTAPAFGHDRPLESAEPAARAARAA